MESRLVQVNDTDLNVSIVGRGEPVVLLHSLGLNRHLYDALVARLAPHYRTICLDLRGHGDSSLGSATPAMTRLVDDLAGVLEAVDVRAAHFVGQSIGAMTLLEAACHGRIEGSVFALDAVAWSTAEWDERYLSRAAKVRRDGMSAIADEVARGSIGATTQSRRPELVTSYSRRLSAASHDGYAWCCEAMTGFDYRPALADVGLPVHLLTGTEDLIATVDEVREIAACVPGATFTAVPDSGHVPVLEQFETVASLLEGWLSDQHGRAS